MFRARDVRPYDSVRNGEHVFMASLSDMSKHLVEACGAAESAGRGSPTHARVLVNARRRRWMLSKRRSKTSAASCHTCFMRYAHVMRRLALNSQGSLLCPARFASRSVQSDSGVKRRSTLRVRRVRTAPKPLPSRVGQRRCTPTSGSRPRALRPRSQSSAGARRRACLLAAVWCNLADGGYVWLSRTR